MPFYNIPRVFLLILLFLPTLAIWATEPQAVSQSTVSYDSSNIEVRYPSAEKLATYESDNNFWYDRQQMQTLSVWHKIWRWISRNILQPIFHPQYAGERRLIFYLFIALVFGFAIYKLRGSQYTRAFFSASQSDAPIFDQVENIHQMDFDKLITEAAARQEYRRAVRLHYLKSLKSLTQLALVHWKPDKTNSDYLNELASERLKPIFRDLTYLFEYTWYGDFKLDNALYEKTATQFRNFERELKQSGNGNGD